MPASPQEIEYIRKTKAAERKRDAFKISEAFFNTLDEEIAGTPKNDSGEYSSINLGEVYDIYVGRGYRDGFSVSRDDGLLFAAAIRKAYMDNGWKLVEYIYPKSYKSLYDIQLFFSE